MRRGKVRRPVRIADQFLIPVASGQSNVLSQNIRRGVTLYRGYNGFGPKRLVRVDRTRSIPPVVVDLGELVGLIYRSDKWQRGRPRTYIHFMENPPRLVSNPAGNQFYIVGGNYRVTRCGIEG